MEKTFLDDLRRALNHLYDPDILGSSSLCALFGITSSYDRARKLQSVLEKAIQALAPSAEEAGYTRKRHLYDLLTYRYLQQFSQKQVADQLGISVSQLARDQQAALQLLAMHLWELYSLSERAQTTSAPTHAPRPAFDLISRHDELAWITLPSPEKQANVTQNLTEALNLAKPLLTQHRIQVDMTSPADLPMVTVHPVALRQIFLNLLSALAQSMAGGQIAAVCRAEEQHISVIIAGEGTEQMAKTTPTGAERELQAARQLVELSGGKLMIERIAAKRQQIALHLPAVKGVPVLVVDDSVDHLNLLQRYLANTRYRLISASDPEHGLQMVAQTRVAAVIVDIMMPRTDGWAVLEHLRATPATAHCPVVICSILPLQELAFTLGADAFLGKPVSQHDLLATLDRLTAQREPGPH